jgi:hypothetical protein
MSWTIVIHARFPCERISDPQSALLAHFVQGDVTWGRIMG